MKKNLYIIVIFTSIVLSACAQSRNIQSSYTDQSYNDNSISYQQFYDDLSPYGQWVDNPEYGYVWTPAESNFQPYYSNGHWAYTNYGWTWVSDYNWGWATFHYGRWFQDDFYGWMWVPGYEWAPAWVSWRSNSDYYGWAPLCPRRRDGSYYQVQNNQWAFVSHQYINRNDLNNYYINKQNNTTVINNTTIINNTTVINNTQTVNNNTTTYPQGPEVTDVEKAIHTKIRPVVIQQTSLPGNTKLQNGVLQIYKPSVKQTAANESSPVPSKLVRPKIESQGVNGRTTMPGNNMDNKLQPLNNNNNNTSINNNPPAATKAPVIRNNQVNDDGNVPDKSTVPATKFNTNKVLNPPVEQSKPMQSYPINPEVQKNPGNAGVNINTQKTQVNQNNNNSTNNNTVQPKPVVAPPVNNFNKINHSNNQQNNQPQSPAVNPGSLRTTPKLNYDRPAPSFQNRAPKEMPHYSPGNLNNGNNGVKK